jgi:hypothetical protein
MKLYKGALMIFFVENSGNLHNTFRSELKSVTRGRKRQASLAMYIFIFIFLRCVDMEKCIYGMGGQTN